MPRRPRGPIANRRCALWAVIGRLRAEWWYKGHRRGSGRMQWLIWSGSSWVAHPERLEGMDMPRALKGIEGVGMGALPRRRSKMLDALPALQGWLMDRQYDDGKPCGVVQLTVRTQSTNFVGTLKIADHGGLFLKVEAESFEDVLVALEMALNAEPTPWEPDPYPLNGTKGKKK